MPKIKRDKYATSYSFNKCRAKWMFLVDVNVIGLSDLYWKLVPTVGGIMAKKVIPLVLRESFSSPSLQNTGASQ